MSINIHSNTAPSGLLIAGILMFPFLFVWQLLDRKYSQLSRILGFGYMLLISVLYVGGPNEAQEILMTLLTTVAMCAVGFGVYMGRQAHKWGWQAAIQQLKQTVKETTHGASNTQPEATNGLPGWMDKDIEVSVNADGSMHLTFPAEMPVLARDNTLRFCRGMPEFRNMTWTVAETSSDTAAVEWSDEVIPNTELFDDSREEMPIQTHDIREEMSTQTHDIQEGVKLPVPKHGWFKVSFLGFPNEEESALSEMTLQNGMTVNDHASEAVDVLCFGDFASNAMMEKAESEGAVVLDKAAFLHFIASGEVPKACLSCV